MELYDNFVFLSRVVLGYLDAADPAGAARWLVDTCGVPPAAAEQMVGYLAATKAVLGLLPTRENLVVERFFDDSGGMQLIIHAPFGARINRAWGLALRKRFCGGFGFVLFNR